MRRHKSHSSNCMIGALHRVRPFSALFIAVALQAVSSAQSTGVRDVISSGNNGVKARVSSQPTSQILLDRTANSSSRNDLPGSLELGNPTLVEDDSMGEVRPISTNPFQQSLPAAARPSSPADYSTSSPYQLRSVGPAAKNGVAPLKVTPVSTASRVDLSSASTSASEEPKASAPKVARKPVPQTSQSSSKPSPAVPSNTDQPAKLNLPSEPSPLDSLPASEPPALQPAKRFTPAVPSKSQSELTLPGNSADSPLPNLPPLGSAPSLGASSNDVPSLDLSSLPTLDGPKPQAVAVPALLPSPSATELKGQSSQLPSLMPDVDVPSINRGLSSPSSMGSLPSLPGADSPSQPLQMQSNRQSTGSMPNASAMLPQANRSSGIERIKMQSPRLQVVLNGPPELAIGEAQAYTVTVHNEDKINLGGIILRLDIPPGVVAVPQKATHGQAEVERAADGTTMLTWSFENLEGNSDATLPLNVMAQVSRNFAVAMEWTILPMSSNAGIDVLTPQLELALEGPSEVNFSEANVYRLHIRNRGNADAQNVAVKLSAQHFGSSATNIEKIAAGTQQTVDVELVFNEPGNITISAEANATGNVASAAQVGVRVRQSVLEAAIEAPEVVYHSSPTPYVLRVRNMGDAAAKSARAVITLPADCTPQSLPPEATVQNGTIVWDLNQLRPGAISELAFKLSFAREGDNRVSVHCSSNSGAPVQCAAVTLVKAVSDLKLYVTDPVAPAPVGGEVEYELKLVNRGSKAAEQVSVVALFSKDIEPTRAEGQRSQILTGQVRFQPITRVEPGQTITLRVFAQAATAGMHRFRAEVRTAEAEVKLVQEQSTEYMESIRRTASSPSNVIR